MDRATHEETFNEGMRIRRSVLGDAHVDASLSRATVFSRPIQDLVTEYCWGEIWGDDRLPLRTRSLINIAMLTALNRHHELAVHVRGALNNEVTVGEIQATLMQTAVYVGVPAALESFRIAERVIVEYGANE